MNESLPEIALIVVLVLLNGIFSATEIALVTLRRSRIQQLIDEGNRAAVRVQRLKANPGRFLAVIRRAGLPRPDVNAVIDGYMVDFAWQAERVIVETDGWQAHGTASAFQADRAATNALLLAGYVTFWFAALARAQAVDVTAILVIGAVGTAVIAGVVDGVALAPQAPWLITILMGAALVAWSMVRRPTVQPVEAR